MLSKNRIFMPCICRIKLKQACKDFDYKLVSYFKESTGFEPARQGKLGSPDFESGALPLCQLSTTIIIIHDIGKTAKLILQFY